MKTLVTGGAGFIGSHLVEKLLSLGHSVTAIDNYSTGRKANLDFLKSNKSLKAVDADIADFAAIVPSIQNPAAYHRSNVDGTLSVLEAARKPGVKRLQYAASSSCYGIPDRTPTPETASMRPQYPYALTKNMGEQMVMHWGKIYKLPVVSTRFFNVYGPRSRTSGTYGAVF